ncbi:MAG: S-methyl-5'-thioinosine phosphorylase [Gammaproteobacteria bacterium]
MSAALIGVIGGSGMDRLRQMKVLGRQVIPTPFGPPSAPVIHGSLGGGEGYFLARHGSGHTLAPHEVNYRANIWALHSLGIHRIIAINTVGAIRAGLTLGELLLPDQIVDYTWGRAHTFHDGASGSVLHVDFTEPYSSELRGMLRLAATAAGVSLHDGGTYGATQGPRLESRSEIDRMERDGCDVVGMTGMPEAALAREMGLEYASCCVVVNMAAGRGDGGDGIHAEIERFMDLGMGRVRAVLERLMKNL